MALYLSMDGVDDYLKLPLTMSSAYDKIEFDTELEGVKAYNRYLIATPSNIFRNNANGNSLFLSGVSQTGFALGSRVTITGTFTNGAKNSINTSLFSNSDGATGMMGGKVYSIKVYNNTTLVAHYNMTAGTVQDQSGNGNHATLTGGTWIDDGVGGTTTQTASASLVGIGSVSSSSLAIRNSSTDLIGTGTFTASQLIVKNAQVDLLGLGTLTATAEGISIVTASVDLLGIGSFDVLGQREILGTLSLSGQGVLNANGLKEQLGNASLSGQGLFTVQTSDVTIITADASLIGTGQIITDALKIINGSGSLLGNGLFDVTGKRIVSSQSDLFGSGQLIANGYKIVIADASLVGQGILTIIDGEPIIGTIKLKADRQLYVYLVANRDLYVKLKGGLDVTAENQSLIMYSGDTKNLDFELPNADLNGSTLKWVLKKSAATVENILLKTESSGISILEGLIRVKLDPADTELLKGTHYHELELTDVVGNVSTLATGLITIKPSGV